MKIKKNFNFIGRITVSIVKSSMCVISSYSTPGSQQVGQCCGCPPAPWALPMHSERSAASLLLQQPMSFSTVFILTHKAWPKTNTGQDNCSVWESIQACAYIPLNPWQLMHFKILPEWGYTRVEPEPDWARKCCAQPLWRLQASFCCTKIKKHQSRSHRYQKVPTELTWTQWKSW